MPSKMVCKYGKYGYCKLQWDCKDYHPPEVCKEPVCNVAKCMKRHPQPSSHAGTTKNEAIGLKNIANMITKKKTNTNELLEKIKKR